MRASIVLFVFLFVWGCDDSSSSTPSDTADLTVNPTDMSSEFDATPVDSTPTITPDASADAGDPPYVPDIAEEQPTDGNADLPGATGLTMPVAVGLVALKSKKNRRSSRVQKRIVASAISGWIMR